MILVLGSVFQIRNVFLKLKQVLHKLRTVGVFISQNWFLNIISVQITQTYEFLTFDILLCMKPEPWIRNWGRAIFWAFIQANAGILPN